MLSPLLELQSSAETPDFPSRLPTRYDGLFPTFLGVSVWNLIHSIHLTATFRAGFYIDSCWTHMVIDWWISGLDLIGNWLVRRRTWSVWMIVYLLGFLERSFMESARFFLFLIIFICCFYFLLLWGSNKLRSVSDLSLPNAPMWQWVVLKRIDAQCVYQWVLS